MPINLNILRLPNSDKSIPLPQYATAGSAGMDIYAMNEEEILIKPTEVRFIPTGFSIELTEGFEAQIRPRSGLAVKHGITILNAPGTIDSDYRGEVKIILINHGKNTFSIKKGDKIAQMIISKFERINWIESNTLNETERGSGGFGHTGI